MRSTPWKRLMRSHFLFILFFDWKYHKSHFDPTADTPVKQEHLNILLMVGDRQKVPTTPLGQLNSLRLSNILQNRPYALLGRRWFASVNTQLFTEIHNPILANHHFRFLSSEQACRLYFYCQYNEFISWAQSTNVVISYMPKTLYCTQACLNCGFDPCFTIIFMG
jgi:hypothetical protein